MEGKGPSRTAHRSQCGAASGLRQRHGAPRPHLLSDAAGAMFLLAGILLVLGFVALGATVYTTSSLKEDGQRDQRASLTQPVSDLLGELNLTARGATTMGDTNVTDFLQRLEYAEDQVRTQASRNGIYLELAPQTSPDPALFQRPSRCVAYDPARSQDGVIVGYETTQGLETIVGVVYHIKATDGRETLELDTYIQIAQCLPDQYLLIFDGLDVDKGSAYDIPYGKLGNDGDAALRLEETPEGQQSIEDDVSPDIKTLQEAGWAYTEHVEFDDHKRAVHPATPLNDYMRFKMDTSDVSGQLLLSNVTARIDVWMDNVTDDYLEVRAIKGGDLIWTWQPSLTSTEQTLRKPLGATPAGNTTWRPEEVADVELLFKVIEVDKFDPPAFFYVDYATLEFDFLVPDRHILDVGVDYPRIPAIYSSSEVEIRYSYGAADTPEDLHLQFHDTVTDHWNTRLLLNDTDGAWVTKTYNLTTDEVEDGYIELRIVDSDRNDWAPDDGDTIAVDYLVLRNRL